MTKQEKILIINNFFLLCLFRNFFFVKVINFYFNLLMERGGKDKLPSVYVFNTFFYPKLCQGGHSALKRWTRRVDIFTYDLILIPIHLGIHWCLAVSFLFIYLFVCLLF